MITFSHHPYLQTAAVLCLLSSSSLAFQINDPNEIQGILSNDPLGLIAAGTAGADIVIRSGGQTVAEPTPWSPSRFTQSTAINPDFTNAALLAGLNHTLTFGGTPATETDFTAISTGGEVCPPISSTGIMQGGNSWYQLSITLKKKPPGRASGVPGSKLASLDHPAGTLLSYYLDDNAGIFPSYNDITLLEQTSEQIGFITNPGVDITAADWGMGSIATDPTFTRTQFISPIRNRFYFAVSAAWAAGNPSNLALDEKTVPGSQILVPLSADNVYLMKWEQDPLNSTYQWSEPELAFSSFELFGVETSDIQIDAISVYADPSETADRLVLSTTAESGQANQLLGYSRHTMAAPQPVVIAQPLKNGSDVLFSTKLGIAEMGTTSTPDDVNSTCGRDPESGSISKALGTPIDGPPLGYDLGLGLSVYRSVSTESYTFPNSDPFDRVDIHATGLGTNSGGGTALLLVAASAAGTIPAYPLTIPLVWSIHDAKAITTNSSTAAFTMPGGVPGAIYLYISVAFVPAQAGAPIQVSPTSVMYYDN